MNKIKFGKRVKEVKMEDETVLKLPEYCTRRINYYIYNKESKNVEIRCRECGKEYSVLKAEKLDGKWVWRDIHDEEKYHFISEKSGFDAVCNDCKKIKEKEFEEGNRDKEGYTILLTARNKQYLQLRKVLYKDEISKIVNELIDEERKRHPVKWIE